MCTHINRDIYSHKNYKRFSNKHACCIFFFSGVMVKVLILFGNNSAFHAQLRGLGAPVSPPRALDLTSSTCSSLLPPDAYFGDTLREARDYLVCPV